MTFDPVVVVALVTAAGAVLAALIAWLTSRRQSSGRIATSDATTLWSASETMRRELREEVVALRAQAIVLLEKIDNLEKRLAEFEQPHG